ncbi:DNA-protecting protein DprA [Acetobacteraceae bacterium]|nr:DNA-protecting protein DprA [Acetobacteraceae bacterium]
MSKDWTIERLSRFRLARTAGIGPLRFLQALERFQTAENALKTLIADKKISPPSLAKIEDEIADVKKLGGETLIYGDSDYPQSLAVIPDAPPILHFKGKQALLKNRNIAIVGARNASSAGLSIANLLAKDLAKENITIVSGLASGIDGQAHRAALSILSQGASDTGSTIAALPGGLDVIYPREHQGLYEEIAHHGCVITEAPPGASILARHFPRRNRLIAGISLGAVIIEAARKSGTLITAQLSLDYGRLVFAVPGSPIDPRSLGGNNLLKEGAILVENVQDILPQLPKFSPTAFSTPVQKTSKQRAEEKLTPSLFSENTLKKPSTDINCKEEDLPPHAKKILSLLSPVPIAIDNLIRQSQLSVQDVLTSISLLNMLEMLTLHEGDTVSIAPQK